MSVFGPTFPTIGVARPDTGDVAWSAPTNIQADDNAFAQANLSGLQTSQYAVGYNFGFACTGSSVVGILVEIDRKDSNSILSSTIRDLSVYLATYDSFTTTLTLKGTNHADTGTDWPHAKAFKSYGGSSDDWGAGFSVSGVNDPTFAVAVRCQLAGGTNETGNIDSLRVTITTASGDASLQTILCQSGFNKLIGRGQAAFRDFCDQSKQLWTPPRRRLLVPVGVSLGGAD